MARNKAGKGQRKEPLLFADRGRSTGRGERAGRSVRKRRSFGRWILGGAIKLSLVATVLVAAVIGYAWLTLEQKGLFAIPARAPGIMILASDGSVLAEQGAFYGDAARIDELPDYVPNAIIAVEDRRFREHFGIDPKGLMRAMYHNFQAGRMVEGGSTLTQQLAKNLFLTPERTAWRKLQEMVLAVWLERKFTKDEILQLYLNRVYFAGGSNGIERAAQSLYNTTPNELNLNQAATLAGLLKAPSSYNPVQHPEAASRRTAIVLNAMAEEGYITEDDAKQALAEPAAVKAADYIPAKQYVVDWINDQLPELVKSYDQSIVIETTLDPVIQANAEQALRQRLNENGKKLKIGEGAIVVLDPKGAVKAMVGGRSYKKSQYNRAATAKRQPGSAFKPFVYLAAIENGYRPESRAIDEPIRIGNWSPDNYKHKYWGEVTLETAFAQSLNTVAARLAMDVGITKVVDVARRLGITSPLVNDASLALGTSEVSLLELTSAFVPFANGGTGIRPYVVTRISTRAGDMLYERLGSGLGKVVTDYDLGAMNTLFRAVVRHGTAVKAQFGGFDIGGKTGTSQDYRDAWFLGFTNYYVAGVWLGNDDNTPTRNVTGGSLPAVIWRDVMEPAHAGLAAEILPGEMTAPSDQVAGGSDATDVVGPETAMQDDISMSDAPLTQARRKRTLLDFLFGDDDEQPGRRQRNSDSLY